MEIISQNKTAVNTVEAEVKVDAAEFEEAVQTVFLKRRKSIQIDGFRKGKATRKMIEARYGENVFYEEAVNSIYQKTVSDAIDKMGLDVVDIPNTEVTSVNKEEGVTFKVTYTVKPEVNISGYKGLKIEKPVKNITDDDINAEIEKVREQNARIIDVTDRAAQKGDTVVFDFEGFADGEAFEGGKAENFRLELGSGRFIPGFEEQVEGKNIDEDFEVNVTFPEDYNAKKLAGKPAVFKCKIHEIKAKELEEVDDEFVKDVSEFDTLDEYKADIRKKLEERSANSSAAAVENELSEELAKLLEGEIPPVMIENRVNDMLREWEYRNRYAGVTLNDYLKYTGMTLDMFKATLRGSAAVQVKLRLALEKIAELENITVSDEDLDARFKELAEEHNMDIERVKEVVSAKNLAEDVKAERAFDLVKESADITEVDEKDYHKSADAENAEGGSEE